MTSGGEQGWRGGKSRRGRESEEKAKPSWKRSRAGATGERRKKNLWLRSIFPVLILAVLVIGAILLYRAAQQIQTHIVVMDLIAGSLYFEAAGVPRLPGQSQEGGGPAGGSEQVTQNQLKTLNLFSAASGADRSLLDDSDVLVVYLQTVFLPEGENGFRCLVRNSTPNLDHRESEYESLDQLFESLKSFRQQYGSKPVLLIVDVPPSFSDWRLGITRTTLTQKLEQWISEIPRLVIVTGSGDAQHVSSAGPGTSGTTVFGHFVGAALSSQADQDQDQLLRVSEFCRFVEAQTDQWVRRNRDAAGQQIQVFPALSEIQGDEHPLNFVILKDPPPVESDLTFAVDPAWITELIAAWRTREELDLRGARLWNAPLWNAVTGNLTKAESAWLCGQSQNAARLLKDAQGDLQSLRQVCDSACPDRQTLLTQRGLSQQTFVSLPVYGRLSDLWTTVPESAVSPAKTPLPERQEELLQRQLTDYPWQQLGLPVPPSDAVEAAVQRRRDAEEAVADLYGVADRVRRTVMKAERQLLLDEDRLFVRNDGQTTAVDSNAAPTSYADLAEIGRLTQEADATLARVLSVAPGLAQWCAAVGPLLGNSDREGWVDGVLRVNSASVVMSVTLRDQLLSRIAALSGTADSTVEGQAQRLRAEAAKLLILARGLQSALRFTEPDDGYSSEQLAGLRTDLSTWLKAVRDSVQAVEQRTVEHYDGISKEEPATHSEQLRVYRFLVAALQTDFVPADKRGIVFQRIIHWQGQFSEPPDQDAAGGGAATEAATAVPAGSAEESALWLLQYLNLAAGSVDGSHPAAGAWRASEQLVVSGGGPVSSAALSEFGHAVRDFWKVMRDSLREAENAAGPELYEMNRIADQRSRLLPVYDAKLLSGGTPYDRLAQLHGFQYGLLHVTRLAESQWISEQDQVPWGRNGWYARFADVWIRQVRADSEKLGTASGSVPPVIVQALNDAEDRLRKVDDLRIVSTPSGAMIDLSDQNVSRRTADVQIQVDGNTGRTGEVAVLVLPDEQQKTLPVRVENNAESLSLARPESSVQLNITRLGNPGQNECRSVTLQTSTFFRGRKWTSPSPLTINPCAGAEFVVTRTALPPTASVTVIGSDPRPIVLILDWSRSMVVDLKSAPTETRSNAALDTLEELIERQSLADTRLSLKVYGHRVNYESPQRPNVQNEIYKSLFNKSIPDRIGALQDIATEFPMQVMNDDGKVQFRQTLSRLRRLPPWGITPLASAITESLDVDLQNQAGIVIAVTDGEAKDVGPSDNPEIAAENELRKTNLKKALARNRDSRVFIVAFDLESGNPERQSLEQIFVRECGITVIDAADKGQLVARIQQSLPPRQFEVLRDDAVTPPESMDLGGTVTRLKPNANYRIQFGDLKTPADVPIYLAGGDHLKVNLDLRQQEYTFNRDVPSQMKASATEDFSDDRPVILRAVEPAKLSDIDAVGPVPMSKMEVTVMLDHRSPRRPVRHPAEIEFLLRPRESDYRVKNVLEQFNSQYGAPAWTLSVDQWPRNHDVLVDAFWKFETTAPQVTLPWSDLRSADRPENAKTLGGDGAGLPQMTVWTRLLDSGVLQVRLDRVPQVPVDPSNLPEDVRVQVGQRDARELNSRFSAEELNTTVRKSESGSVIFEFDGNFTTESLVSREISFTSLPARKQGAVHLTSPLLVDKTR